MAVKVPIYFLKTVKHKGSKYKPNQIFYITQEELATMRALGAFVADPSKVVLPKDSSDTAPPASGNAETYGSGNMEDLEDPQVTGKNGKEVDGIATIVPTSSNPDFENMTVAELKAFAAEKGIEYQGNWSKTRMMSAIEEWLKN